MDYSTILFSGLTHNDGFENSAGLEENALLIIIGDLQTEAVPDPAAATPEALMTIAGNHVLKANKAPIPCFTITEKSDFESALAGEMYSKTFQPNVTLFIPQNTLKNVAQFSMIKNSRLMVLAKFTGDQYYTQVGTKALTAKVKEGSVKQGKGPSGEKGITFVLEAFSIHPYYSYQGALPAPAAAGA